MSKPLNNSDDNFNYADHFIDRLCKSISDSTKGTDELSRYSKILCAKRNPEALYSLSQKICQEYITTKDKKNINRELKELYQRNLDQKDQNLSLRARDIKLTVQSNEGEDKKRFTDKMLKDLFSANKIKLNNEGLNRCTKLCLVISAVSSLVFLLSSIFVEKGDLKTPQEKLAVVSYICDTLSFAGMGISHCVGRYRNNRNIDDSLKKDVETIINNVLYQSEIKEALKDFLPIEGISKLVTDYAYGISFNKKDIDSKHDSKIDESKDSVYDSEIDEDKDSVRLVLLSNIDKNKKTPNCNKIGLKEGEVVSKNNYSKKGDGTVTGQIQRII